MHENFFAVDSTEFLHSLYTCDLNLARVRIITDSLERSSLFALCQQGSIQNNMNVHDPKP